MANAVTPQKTLRIGVDEALYVATGGAINATGTSGTAPNGCFGIPPQASNYRGRIVFQAVPRGGTVTSAVFQLEVSLDGGNTFGIYTHDFGITAAPSTLTRFSGFDFFATGQSVVSLDISGLGGNGQIRLNFTTVTLGTGTGFDVYAHIG